MNVQGPSSGGGPMQTAMAIEAAMLRKGKQQAEVQGQQALKLIESTSKPATSGHVGRNLNVVG